jgi:PAS domain S-box-containing protein
MGSRLHYGSIVRDVTEAKRTEKLLQESEKKYRDIVNATNDALFVLDMQGRFLEVNDSACRQLGYTRGELLCRGPMTICPPEHADKVAARMKEVVKRGHYVFETIHLTKDGRRIPVEISAQKLTYQGTPALLGVVRDISERSRVLEALVQSEEKYRVIFNNEVYAICIFDIETLRFLDANEAFERMYGHTREELLAGMTIHDVTAQHQESDAATEQATRQGTIFIPLRYHRRKDGTVIPVEIVGGPYVWQGKRVMFGLFHDISDRVRAEKALKESEARFREIFYHASDAIHVHRRQPDGRPGKLIDFNDVAAEMLGFTREEMLASPPIDVGAAFHEPPLEKVLESLRLKGRARFETELVRKDGSRVPVEVNSHVLVQQGDEVTISLVRDVTDKKRAMTALRLANKKLSLLTSITRHDMNNSLIALRGNVELLKHDMPEMADNPRVRAISNQAKRLDGMVSFTKSYESFGTLEPTWHELRQMVGEASAEVQWGDAALVNDVPVGVQVLVDPLTVKVFVNLMDNSLRHGERVAKVSIFCRQEGSSLVITCQDDGVGIPWGEKERIFELGYGRNTGLGLFLSREVLDLTGISIVENGEPSKGARFVLAVPAGHFRWQ